MQVDLLILTICDVYVVELVKIFSRKERKGYPLSGKLYFLPIPHRYSIVHLTHFLFLTVSSHGRRVTRSSLSSFYSSSPLHPDDRINPPYNVSIVLTSWFPPAVRV